MEWSATKKLAEYGDKLTQWPEMSDSKQKLKADEIVRILHDADIHFICANYRTDAISFLATIPGERWEIDILEDGEVELERFITKSKIEDENKLKALVVKQREMQLSF